jgi:hypothetical protein
MGVLKAKVSLKVKIKPQKIVALFFKLLEFLCTLIIIVWRRRKMRMLQSRAIFAAHGSVVRAVLLG